MNALVVCALLLNSLGAYDNPQIAEPENACVKNSQANNPIIVYESTSIDSTAGSVVAVSRLDSSNEATSGPS
jgi:hypothetical protein